MTSVTDRVASFSAKLRSRLGIVARCELSAEDRELVLDAIVMRFALLHDLSDGSTQAEITANWERTVLGLRTLDVELYTSDWKTLREILTSVEFRRVCLACPDAAIETFKQSASGRIHYKWILNSALQLMAEGDDWYAKVNQWVVFDARLNLVSLDLTVECCEEYLAFEAELPDDPDYWERQYEWASPHDMRLLNALKRAIRDMYGDFRVTDYPFRPKHGNGATAEVSRADADPWHKNRHFAVDSEVITYLRYRVPEDEWQSAFYLPYRGLERTSQLVCVPKSTSKNRTISKEPTTLQFLQQDLFAALDDYLSDRPWIGVDLHDQSKSRDLALSGSSESPYATIDLSSASDSVTVAHVEYFFDGLPILYPLMATRSTHVHVESSPESGRAIDATIEMKKFAPMGSAVCFPMESMLFAAICEAAVRSTSGHRSRRNDYRVYGDDIVIRQDYVPETLRLLDFLGFKVNRDKSFGIDLGWDIRGESWLFREACGIEALNGEDITPLRLSRRLVSPTRNDSCHQAGQGVGLVDLLNRTFLYGYWHLRRWLNDQLVKYMWYRTALRLPADDYREFSASILLKRKSYITVSVPFVITTETGATQWRAFKAQSCRVSRYQRCSALVTTAKARGPRVLYHDDNDYFTWCLSALSDPVDGDEFVIDDTGIVTIRSRDLKWSRTWVSLQRPAQLQLRSPRS